MIALVIIAQLMNPFVQAAKTQIDQEIHSLPNIPDSRLDAMRERMHEQSLVAGYPDKIRDAIDALFASERKCRATSACMAKRAFDENVQIMCVDEQQIASAREDIVREKSNPSGVVNLEVLHDDGDTIQRLTVELMPMKLDFMTHAKRPWDAAKECK